MPTLVQSPAALLKHMLTKHNLSGSQFAQAIGISPANVNLILNERIKISIPVALRLAKYFNTAPEYWLILQMRYDLSLANEDKQLVREIKAINVFTRAKGVPGRKPAIDKPVLKKKAVSKKPAVKKTTAKKLAPKKTVRKTASQKLVLKKTSAKKAPLKKTVSRKAAVKKPLIKKAVRKVTQKKPVEKAVQKKVGRKPKR